MLPERFDTFWKDVDFQQAKVACEEGLWFKLIRWGLYWNDYDPFQIYKVQSKSGIIPSAVRGVFSSGIEDGVHYLSELKLDYTAEDALRSKRFGYLQVQTIVFQLRAILMAYIQHTVLRFKVLVPKGYAVPMMSVALLEQLNNWTGNPAEPLNDAAFYYYLGLSGGAVIYFIIMPYYFSKHTLDMPGLRFMLRPDLELRRIDCLIRMKLNEIDRSQGWFCSKFEQMTRFREPRHMPTFSQSKNCIQVHDSLQTFKRHIHILRPGNSSKSCYFELNRILSTSTLGLHIGFGGWFLAFITMMFVQISNCDSFFHKSCNVIFDYNIVQKITLLEIMFSLVMNAQATCTHVSLLVMVIRTQGELIKSARLQLERCVEELGRCRDFIADHNLLQDYQLLECRKQASQVMLKTLIKISISEVDLKSNFRCLSEFTAHFIFPACLMLFVTYITNGMQADSDYIRQQTMVSVWIIVNNVVILSSYVAARVRNLKKFYWNILAIHSEVSLLLLDRGGDQISDVSSHYVCNMWNKFVFSATMNADEDCAQPFNLRLNYKTTIELNFLAIFIYSLAV